jgi:hypothetical protein
MDMVSSPFDWLGHGPGYPAKAGHVPKQTGKKGGEMRRPATGSLTIARQMLQLLPR